MSGITIRTADISDADAIASLHAQSWIRTYRGLLSDEYLDNGLEEERLEYWIRKLKALKENEFVLLAHHENETMAFICVMDKPEQNFDAFIDNLHVRNDVKGLGIGTRLMNAAAIRLKATGRNTFYLWVLEGNTDAEKFYASKGGISSDVSSAEFGGKTIRQTRFGWTAWSFIK